MTGIALSVARKGLVFAGGVLVAKGYITTEQADAAGKLLLENVDVISGAALTLASIGWSVYTRLTTK